MTDWVPWFKYQLRASADSFVWALSQIPPHLQDQLPPDAGYMGTWPPLRHLWHVTEYERCLPLPSMQQWLGGPLPPGDAWHDEDSDWAAVQEKSLDALSENFLRVRQQQIDLLDQLASADWLAPRETLWGLRPLSFIVTKTFQHTYEHGDTLLRMGLWWEFILARIAESQEKTKS